MKPCNQKSYNCPVEATLDLIGGKWKCLIMWHLSDNILRFNELRKFLPNVTQKMLTQQLRDLERDGLLVRKVYAEVPPKVEYSLSELGRSVRPVLESMCEWGSAYMGNQNRQCKSRCND